MSWLDIFNPAFGTISLQMMIDTIAQRSDYVVCTSCALKKCVMYDHLKPSQYLIFNAHKADRRFYWNNHIIIGDLRYKMIGVAKHSRGHFSEDCFRPPYGAADSFQLPPGIA